jgi:hypothetical protein
VFKTGLAAVSLMFLATVLAAPANAGRCDGKNQSAQDFWIEQMICR